MIISIILIIFSFLFGVVDKSLSMELFGNSFFLGCIIFLSLSILFRESLLPLLLTMFYFVGFSLNQFPIGLLPLFILLIEYLYFNSSKLVSSNKIGSFLSAFILFLISYLSIYISIYGFSLNLSLNFIKFIICIGLIGGGVSLFQKFNER